MGPSPVERFSSRAADYAAGRPGYPEAAIAEMLRDSLALQRPRVVDVGAGTALSSELLAGAAGFAVALEPNAAMLRAARRQARLALARGRAEALPLRAGSVDLLTAFNAFHWFEPASFLAEARRVLAPGGRLALAWNDWDLRDAFTAAFVALMRRQAEDAPPEDRDAEVAPLYESGLFGDVRRRAFPLRHRLGLAQLLARMRSVSYVAREGPEWDRLAPELRALFEAHADADGTVSHHYVTAVFVAAPKESSVFSAGAHDRSNVNTSAG